MLNRWQCPKCSFYNDYSQIRCASCNTPRPDNLPVPLRESGETSPRTADRERVSADIPRPAPVEKPREAPGPGTTPQPRMVPAPPTKKRSSRSAIRWALLGVMAFIGVLTAVGVIAGHSTDGDIDSSYIDAFWNVNSTRNDVIDASNSRYDEWLATSTELPGPEYLVVAELVDLQAEAELMVLPESDELLSLHQDWLAGLHALVEAEQLLATDPTDASFEANLDAWGDEDVAYTPLFEYCSGR